MVRAPASMTIGSRALEHRPVGVPDPELPEGDAVELLGDDIGEERALRLRVLELGLVGDLFLDLALELAAQDRARSFLDARPIVVKQIAEHERSRRLPPS